MKKGDVVEVTIDSLNFGGEGVARHETDDGRLVVFVEDTVPDDIVRVRIATKKRNYAVGYAVDFVKKAENRIQPRCRHFGAVGGCGGTGGYGGCGGCTLQFLGYEDQLNIKEQQVRDAIKRIGGFDADVVLPIIGCRDPWFYRNKMEFSFDRARANEGPAGAGQAGVEPTGAEHAGAGRLSLGLHVRRRHHDLIELTECFLLNDYVGALVARVRDFFHKKESDDALAPEVTGEMRLLSLVIREGKNTGEIMINLVAENGEPEFLDEFVNVIVDYFESGNFPENLREKGAPKKSASAARPSDFSGKEGPAGSKGNFQTQKLVSIYFTKITNRKGSPKSIEEKLLWGAPVIHEEMKLPNGAALKFEISPQAFFQPNTAQAEVLYGEVLMAARLNGAETVFDLFCGAGTIGIFCASAAKKVYGIEMNESAVKNARKNAELNDLKNIEFIAGDVAKKLSELPAKPDIIIVDPPRGGIDPKALELTARLAAQRIVYVSCNPTTLARDLKLFTKTGYKLLAVQPVDMFPQTYHIECVATLERSESA